MIKAEGAFEAVAVVPVLLLGDSAVEPSNQKVIHFKGSPNV